MVIEETNIIADSIEDFVDVPDGIGRLRKAVITLAVSGHLAPQDSKEGVADSLYKKIQEERVKEAKKTSKKQKPLSPISDEEIPFEIPKTWKWVRLGELTDYGSPKKIKHNKVKNGTLVIELEDIEKETGNLLHKHYYPEREIKSDRNLFHKGDLLYGKLRPYLRKALVANDDGVCSTEIMPMHMYSGCEGEFFKYVVLSAYFTDYANRLTSGINLPRLRTADGRNVPVPLPSVEEQKRIVERVNGLMKIIDELEVKKKERDDVRSSLAVSAFYSLGSNDSSIALEHMTKLVKNLDDVKELEKGIFSLAVSGKLVPQDPKEGTSEDLYKKIQEERTKEVKKTNKKLKLLPLITKNGIPFKVPDSWEWLRLGDIDKIITDGEHISPTKHKEGVPLLTAKNVLDDGVIFNVKDFVTKKDANRFWKRCNPENGDLLICSRGTIGRTTTVNTDERFVLMGSVILVKFFNNITASYVKYYLRTYSGLFQIGLLKKGMAVNALYLKDVKTAMLPIPPIKEQERIVKKVDEIMVLIKELKAILS